MKKFIILFVALLLITSLVAALHAFAQGAVPIGPGDGDGTTAPLGFLEVLAVAGGGYAIKKLHEKSE